MAQIDGMHRQGEATRPPSSPTTVEEFLGFGENSRFLPFSKEHDVEDDHVLHKKSVLAKVKEKARKWKNTLSKKKHGGDDNATPSWGVSLEDVVNEGEEDEDPEYLGAPMYESEMAPEGYKETARQHPRANPVISEKKILANITANSHNNNEASEQNPYLKRTYSTNNDKKFPIYRRSLSFQFPKTISETVATVTEATYAIASKIQSLAISNPEDPNPNPNPNPETNKTSLSDVTAEKEEMLGKVEEDSEVRSGNNYNGEQQVWDKGVSVKEYLMQKLEPGEDEKALSQVITQVISPKKVKEAVTTFIRNDDQSSSKPAGAYHSAENSLSQIPISTNAHEVVEEESHGRILQAN